MSSVGRPPEVDSDGEVVLKCLVNVTIPAKLANFLKKKGINRSKLFRNSAMKLYKRELCDRCYSDNIETTRIGTYCRDCNDDEVYRYLTFNKCENCDTKYQPPYNMFAQPKDKSFLSGCWDCIPKKERA